MLIEAHSCHIFRGFTLLNMLSQAWMSFDHEKFAKSINILVEFPSRLEILQVDMLGVNGLVFSERPNFLHFKLYK